MSANICSWPLKSAELQNHHMDSTRWDKFAYREGDIVIGTWAKSGTTWMQQIIAQLIFNGAEKIPVLEISPWLEHRAGPLAPMLEMLDAQAHRRFLKTHLPATTLQASPLAKYIYIARDGRDALWSWYEHHCSYTDLPYKLLNETPGLVGPPFERPGSDVVEYFRQWLARDGHPAWPFFSNIQSWWDVRREPNVLMIHFNALKADLEGEMRKIADFCDFDVEEKMWPSLVDHCTFDYMKANADQLTPRLSKVFVHGGNSLINRGKNDRWRNTLSEADSRHYEATAAKVLSPDCAAWLATGKSEQG